MGIVERIKELCASRGITLNQLAKAVGLKSTIARWEDHEPSVDKVRLVAQYFGVTVSEVLGEKEEPVGVSTDGLDAAISNLSPELREQFVRLLALAERDPDRAARYLAFLTQELGSPQ